MAQDRFYMAVEKQSYNPNKGYRSFINLDDLDTDDYRNFDKVKSVDDKIPLYPYNHGYSTSSNNDSSYSLDSSSSTSLNFSSTFKKANTEPTKNDIFDSPITLVRPAPRVSAKEIEELQKQEKLREEMDQKEKEKAREEITLKMDKGMTDPNNMYLKWKTRNNADYNILFKGKNDKPVPLNSSISNRSNSYSGSDSDSFLKKSEKKTQLFTESPHNYASDNSSHPSSPQRIHQFIEPKKGIITPQNSNLISKSNIGRNLKDQQLQSNNDNHLTTKKSNIKSKLNQPSLELSKLQIKSSPSSSPRYSKNLSPEEQITRFLNMPFLNSYSQLSPTSALSPMRSSERLKTKSSFYGLSASFSNSYQMDQESLGKLQKVWNELYQKFVEDIPNINLSYLPTRKNLIGRGQYCNVYLGLYSVNEDESEGGGEEEEDELIDLEGVSNHHEEIRETNNYDLMKEDSSPLKQCAVKCFHKDYVSQMVAMTELNILTMLTNQPYIIQLIGIINETEENKAFFRESSYSSYEDTLTTPKSNESKEDDTEPIRVVTILEYASNGNIFSWIKKNPEYVSKKLWIKWARQITHAVATFHDMLIIHHDIKPQNILLDDYLNAKIADFGSSCYAPDEFPDQDDLTIENCKFPMEMGLGRGTQAYCAPELFSSEEYYTFATDIYSLGVTLIAMMTGKEPFKMARNNIHMIMCIRKGFFGSGVHDSELRFLNGEIAEPKIVDLLKSCVDLDPKKRPTATKILELLMEIDDFVPLEEKL